LRGWGSTHPVFERVLASVEARDILEVGSWKGASALHMAALQRNMGRADSEIVCVDTCLGSLEFWTDRSDGERYRSLNLRYGYPTVYYTFLSNVLAAHEQEVITPFPITSAIAARFFAQRGLSFDVIYIDGSHDEADVAADLASYWPLVRFGGVMFGDDYDNFWPGVKRSVNSFVSRSGIDVETFLGKWIIRKGQ